MDLSNDLRDNYEQLRLERGWSYEQLADHVATTDPRLGAYFRSNAGVEALKERTPPALAQASLDELAADAAADGVAPTGYELAEVDELAQLFEQIGAPLTEQQLVVLKARADDAPGAAGSADSGATTGAEVGRTIAEERAAGEARRDVLQPQDSPNPEATSDAQAAADAEGQGAGQGADQSADQSADQGDGSTDPGQGAGDQGDAVKPPTAAEKRAAKKAAASAAAQQSDQG